MPKLAIIGSIEVPSGRRAELLPLLLAHRDRCLKDEPGTMRFEVLIPRDDEARIHLLEVYQDDAAFDAHRSGTSIARWREETAEMGVKIHVMRCTPVE